MALGDRRLAIGGRVHCAGGEASGFAVVALEQLLARFGDASAIARSAARTGVMGSSPQADSTGVAALGYRGGGGHRNCSGSQRYTMLPLRPATVVWSAPSMRKVGRAA